MFRIIVLNLVTFLMLVSPVRAGISPESVLGEYWKDPLFGEASSDQSVVVEILNGTIWPLSITGRLDQTLRVLFINKSDKTHLFVFSHDIPNLLQDQKFQSFVKDEVYHSQLNPITDGQHTHAGTTDLDTAKSIVIPISDNPTILIPAQDKKEILVKLDTRAVINFQCVLEGHSSQEKGVLVVE